MEKDNEIWKDIKGYEGLYQVSSFGRVRSLPKLIEYFDGRIRYYEGKIMKLSNHPKGYLQVRLTKNKKTKLHFIHRLVAETFLENLQNKPMVNHIDGNKQNNNINNLEWATCSENNQHAYDNNLKSDNKKVVMLDFDFNEIQTFNSIHEASRFVNCNFRNIWMVCNNKRNSAGGYKWRYKI